MTYTGYYHNDEHVAAWVYKHDTVNEQFDGFESLEAFQNNLANFLRNTCGWTVKLRTW